MCCLRAGLQCAELCTQSPAMCGERFHRKWPGSWFVVLRAFITEDMD
jgi:hypothetical protein